MPERSISIKTTLSTLAFLGYGSWALYSNVADNSAASMVIAWRAAFIQGSYSAILTLLSMALLELVYRKIANHLKPITAVPLAVTTVMLAQYSLIVPVHAYNNTPNILTTLLPGIIIGSIFSLAYLLNYCRENR